MTEEEKKLFIKLQQDMIDKMQREYDLKNLKELKEKLSDEDINRFFEIGKKTNVKQPYTKEEIDDIFRLSNLIQGTNNQNTGCGACIKNAMDRFKQLYTFYNESK